MSDDKRIKVNPKIATNIILAVAAVIALLFYVGQFFFDFAKIKEVGFWINQIIVGLLMTVLYYAVINIFYEQQRKDDKYINIMRLYAQKLTSLNNLADKKTIEAIEKKVEKLNQKAEFEAKFKILSAAVPNIYCEDLIEFSKSFDNFNKIDNAFWEKYFDKYKISDKRKKLIFKAVEKIKENDFKFKKIRSETILNDTEIKQKISDTYNIEFYYDKEVGKGVLWKFISFLTTGALFASIFIGQGQIPFWDMFIAVITRIFMIVWSISLGANKSVSLIGKRKAAVRARCLIIDGSMVDAALFSDFTTEVEKLKKLQE